MESFASNIYAFKNWTNSKLASLGLCSVYSAVTRSSDTCLTIGILLACFLLPGSPYSSTRHQILKDHLTSLLVADAAPKRQYIIIADLATIPLSLDDIQTASGPISRPSIRNRFRPDLKGHTHLVFILSAFVPDFCTLVLNVTAVLTGYGGHIPLYMPFILLSFQRGPFRVFLASVQILCLFHCWQSLVFVLPGAMPVIDLDTLLHLGRCTTTLALSPWHDYQAVSKAAYDWNLILKGAFGFITPQLE